MDMEQKNEIIEKYIIDLAQKINKDYPGLMDDDKIDKAKEMFEDSPLDLETEIIPAINELAEKVISDFLEDKKKIEGLIKGISNQLNELATLNLNTQKDGLYLSQQQVDLLMIVDINSKEELKNYVEKICGQFPNMSIEDIFPNFDSLTEEQLEDMKKTIFNKYKDSLVVYLDYGKMNYIQKAMKKLEKLGISDHDLEVTIALIYQGKIKDAFNYLNQNYGNDFTLKFNHFMNDDFENIRDVSYEEMVSLLDFIKNNPSVDTIIIATGKFDNSVYNTTNGKIFDPYLTSKAADFCYKNGKHMRYHALFDHSHLDNLINQYVNLNGRTIEELTPQEINLLQSHKNEVLLEMRNFVKVSMNYIDSLNQKYPNLIQEVEVFNELVEKNKKDKLSPYAMVWEKYFGITINEIMSCFNGIEKPNGVSFMYNETTLSESSEKRKKVEEVLYQIEKCNPGCIDKFGDQMHLSEEDVIDKNGLNNLTETAKMIKRIQDGKIIVNGQIQEIKPKKAECTEHDFHFTKQFLDKVNILIQSGENVDLWAIKRSMQDIISETYTQNGVKFDRSTYWSIFGKNDHNLVRTNLSIQKENLERRKKGLKEKKLLPSMNAGLIPDGKKFTKTNNKKLDQNISNITKPKIAFDQRSKSEIQIAEQIKQKNQMIKQNKSKNKELNKPKVKTLSLSSPTHNSNGSRGFTNVLIILSVVSFATGALLTAIYMIVGR